VSPDIEKPEHENQRLDPPCQANHAKPSGLPGAGGFLGCQEAPGWVFRLFLNKTKLCVWSKQEPFAGYPDPLLTLYPLLVDVAEFYMAVSPVLVWSSYRCQLAVLFLCVDYCEQHVHVSYIIDFIHLRKGTILGLHISEPNSNSIVTSNSLPTV